MSTVFTKMPTCRYRLPAERLEPLKRFRFRLFYGTTRVKAARAAFCTNLISKKDSP